MSNIPPSLVVVAVASFAAPALPCGSTAQELRRIAPASIEALPANALVFIDANIAVDVVVTGGSSPAALDVLDGPGALAATEIRTAPLGVLDLGVQHEVTVTGVGDETRTLSAAFTRTEVVDDTPPVFAGPATATATRVEANNCTVVSMIFVVVRAPVATDDTLVAAYAFGDASSAVRRAVILEAGSTEVVFAVHEPIDAVARTYELVAFDIAGNASAPLLIDVDLAAAGGDDVPAQVGEGEGEAGGDGAGDGDGQGGGDDARDGGGADMACACAAVPAGAAPAVAVLAMILVVAASGRRRPVQARARRS